MFPIFIDEFAMLSQTSIIKRLPDHVINQIKAGEVIERPFNVIKELLENSLDASATTIKIELLDAGKRLIQISDNGSGMNPESIILAVDRHTTSKISAFEDLDSLKSFGFRGEALASIASISKFSIKSKTNSDELGHEVTFENGKLIAQQAANMLTGTIITVKDIFCNVPARLKFLRSTATEFSMIHDFLIAMSIAHPHVSFQFLHNGRIVFNHTAQTTQYDRFAHVMGIESSNYVSLQFEHGNFSLSGFAILPEKIRSSQNSIVTFVNGRFVKDKVVRAGIYEGYGGLLMKGVTPSVVIFIQIPSALLDINAHPSKTEIRFYDPIMVQDLIARGIEKGIKTKLTEQFVKTMPISTEIFSAKRAEFKPQSYHTQANARQSSIDVDQTETFESQNILKNIETPQNTPIYESLLTPIKNNGIFSSLRFLNQFARCYLIFESENELWFVDQHAFHERILFEEIQQAHKTNKIAKQTLLNPFLVPVNPSFLHIYEEKMELIKSLGFEIETLREGHIAIHTIPTFLNQKYLDEIFSEISQKLAEEENLNIESIYHHCFSTMACHSAIRAGEELNEPFVQKLMNRSNDVDFFAHCPHGRPVIRKFSQNDVARWFERI